MIVLSNLVWGIVFIYYFYFILIGLSVYILIVVVLSYKIKNNKKKLDYLRGIGVLVFEGDWNVL